MPLAPAVMLRGTAIAGASASENQHAEQAALTLENLRRLAPIGPFLPVVGQWAVYRLGTGANTDFLLVAVLSGQPTDPPKSHWIELSYGSRPEGGALAMKMLIEGDPREPHELHRIIVRLGGGKPTEISSDKLKQVAQKRGPQAPSEGAMHASGETESIQVNAGTFTAHRLDTPVGAVWFSDDAPMFHVVRGTIHGTPFELFGSGTGAKDFVGTPELVMGLGADGGLWVRDAGAPQGATP